MRQEPIKVFGHVTPADSRLLAVVCTVLESWHAEAELQLCGDVLSISYEGTFFPFDDVLDVLQPFLYENSVGKIDLIDMEAWTLTRAAIHGTTVSQTTRDLNTILDFSGH